MGDPTFAQTSSARSRTPASACRHGCRQRSFFALQIIAEYSIEKVMLPLSPIKEVRRRLPFPCDNRPRNDASSLGVRERGCVLHGVVSFALESRPRTEELTPLTKDKAAPQRASQVNDTST